jgi:hypothetical protein
MDSDRPAFLLVSNVGALAAEGAPVSGVIHVVVHDDICATASSDDVGQQHADGLVGTVSLDCFRSGEGLDVPSLELVWDYGAEQAEAEFGTCCEAVFELNTG